MALLPGTYKFQFKAYGNEPGFTEDLTLSGCSYLYPPVTNVLPVVDAGGPYLGTEGSAVSLDASVSDADAGDTVNTTWTYTSSANVDPGATCSFGSANAVDTTVTCTDDGTYTLTLTANDGVGGDVVDTATLELANVNPGVTIAAPTAGALYAVGTTVLLTAPYSDAGANDVPECTVDWDDGSSGNCTSPEAVDHAGVYTITVNVDDGDLGTATATVMIVVYDPSAGFVTGGGCINSPAGAYVADPTLTGKATFGFVARYKKGATVPDGNTEFQFKAGDLNFHSSSYQWLVVNQNGTNAQFKGTGTINGVGSYKFMIWAGDGGSDTFRIKIWTEDEAAVVYDNGAEQPIGGGNIVVHT